MAGKSAQGSSLKEEKSYAPKDLTQQTNRRILERGRERVIKNKLKLNTKMLITKEIEIDMGHRVPNHKSKCRNLHGHRYRIEVGVDDQVITAKGTTEEGMVIDFGDLKEIMMSEIDAKYDHSCMISTDDDFLEIFEGLLDRGQKINIVQFIPTAENIAEFFYGIIKYPLSVRKIKIKHVKIWETPTSTATYEENN